MSASTWSAAYCAGVARLRPSLDAGPDALLALPGPPLGEQPSGALVAAVPSTTAAASNKADLIARLALLASTAKANTAVMQRLGPPGVDGGRATAAAFVAGDIAVQLRLEQAEHVARTLPTTDASAYIRARGDLADQITHWADTSNVEVGRAWALDAANGGTIHNATAADPICRQWGIPGD